MAIRKIPPWRTGLEMFFVEKSYLPLPAGWPPEKGTRRWEVLLLNRKTKAQETFGYFAPKEQSEPSLEKLLGHLFDGCNKAVDIVTLQEHCSSFLKQVNKELLCFRCIAEDPKQYLESIEDKAIANDVKIDLTVHGYQKVYGEPIELSGVTDIDAELKKQLAQLQEMGLRRIIFNQVYRYCRFSNIKYEVYAHEDEPLAFLG